LCSLLTPYILISYISRETPWRFLQSSF